MPDELKPCPWCGGIRPYFTQANGNAWYCLSDVSCPDCKREVHAKNAITAWNALPRAPKWTEYDGTESTLPPKDVTVLLQRFSRSGSLFCEAETPCWFVHGGDEMCAEEGGGDFAQLIVGDRWMPWPGGGEI